MEPTMSETGYQGWKNYATWLVTLHLDNTEWMREGAILVAREAKAHLLKQYPNAPRVVFDWRAGEAVLNWLKNAIIGRVGLAGDDAVDAFVVDAYNSILDDADEAKIGAHYLAEV
jgi:hypothetical protein